MTEPTASLRNNITFEATLGRQALAFETTWGLFSPKAIDEGTALLADHLIITPTDYGLDLGCGYGALGLYMASLAPEGRVDMVDKDFVAVDYANRNAQLNQLSNARAFLSNGFSHIPAEAQYNVIVSNIPAKIGGELLTIFLHDALAHLYPNGRLYVVTISGLKEYMKRNLTSAFGNYEKLKQSRTYTAAVAVKQPD